jgi:hypothetical protein
MRRLICVVAIAVLVVLLVTTVYLCIYAVQKSANALDRYRESARFGILLQALSFLAISALYLLLAIVAVVLLAIILYVLLTSIIS